MFNDVFFANGNYEPAALFGKMLTDLPTRTRSSHLKPSAAWTMKRKDVATVTCSSCPRKFPMQQAATGLNEADCDFCAKLMKFEIVLSQNSAWLHDPPFVIGALIQPIGA